MLGFLLSVIENEEDRISFTEIYHKYKQLLFKTAYGFLDDKSSAEDCIQNTFLNLIKYYDAFKKVPEQNRKAYIMNSCKNAAIKMNKAAHNDLPYVDSVKKQTAADDLRDYTELDIIPVAEMINKLDEKYRQPFILKYVTGFSNEEISDILGISANLVAQRVFRARETLRKLLSEEQNDT